MKEKNLTMVRTINGYHGACVDPKTHIYCREEIREPFDPYFPTIKRCPRPPVEGLFGPAIDRLHEFEKLGVEPDELLAMINCAKRGDRVFIDGIEYVPFKYCQERIAEKNKEQWMLEEGKANLLMDIMRLEKENSELRTMNQHQYENIAELQEEIEKASQREEDNERLKRDLKTSEMSVGDLKKSNSKLFVEKMDLETEVYELKQENEELKQDVEWYKGLYECYVAMMDTALFTCKIYLDRLKEIENERKTEM